MPFNLIYHLKQIWNPSLALVKRLNNIIENPLKYHNMVCLFENKCKMHQSMQGSRDIQNTILINFCRISNWFYSEIYMVAFFLCSTMPLLQQIRVRKNKVWTIHPVLAACRCQEPHVQNLYQDHSGL